MFQPVDRTLMFVGHALLAFALVGGVARRVIDPRRALVLAGVAGAYAAVPDVDILYAPVGVLAALATGTADPFALAGAFWSTGNLVHRAITHSLVVAPVVALAVGRYVGARRAARRPVAGATLLAGVVATATVVSGGLGGVVAVAFALAALGVAEVVVRRTTLAPRTAVGLALVGLASHPFGDLVTGQPPAMFYPLAWTPVTERVTLNADPTLHLLSAFGLELAAVWAGVVVFLVLTGRLSAVGVRTLAPRAAVGLAYAAGVFVLPAPTLELSYPFVFTVLGVGLVGLVPRIGGRVSLDATVEPNAAAPASGTDPGGSAAETAGDAVDPDAAPGAAKAHGTGRSGPADDPGSDSDRGSGAGALGRPLPGVDYVERVIPGESWTFGPEPSADDREASGVAPDLDVEVDLRLPRRESALLTGLAGVTVAWGAYSVAYVLLA